MVFLYFFCALTTFFSYNTKKFAMTSENIKPAKFPKENRLVKSYTRK